MSSVLVSSSSLNRIFFKELGQSSTNVNSLTREGREVGETLFQYYRQKVLPNSTKYKQDYNERQKRYKKTKLRTGFERRPRRKRKKRSHFTKDEKTSDAHLPVNQVESCPVLNKDESLFGDNPSTLDLLANPSISFGGVAVTQSDEESLSPLKTSSVSLEV